MRELPILMNGAMVRAVLDGRKTVTRRVVKNIPWLPGVNENFSQARSFSNGSLFHIAGSLEMTKGFRCPYGEVGDRLWVRETYFGNHYLHPREPEDERELHFRADGVEDFEGERIRWRPGIHMPRWASRISLEVAAVRVERLQHITKAQALAEGIEPIRWGDGPDEVNWRDYGRSGDEFTDPRASFGSLWESINGPDSVADNPWVWVVEFKRIEKEVPDGR